MNENERANELWAAFKEQVCEARTNRAKGKREELTSASDAFPGELRVGEGSHGYSVVRISIGPYSYNGVALKQNALRALAAQAIVAAEELDQEQVEKERGAAA